MKKEGCVSAGLLKGRKMRLKLQQAGFVCKTHRPYQPGAQSDSET